MLSPISTRKATPTDIPFLSRIAYEASLPPMNHCFWADLLVGTETDPLSFIAAMFQVGASNWGNVSDFWVLQEQGQPVAAAAGYTPNAEDYCPLCLSKLDQMAQALNWTQAITTTFRYHYEQFWGGNCRPLFLTPLVPWVIENVAVLPEARGRGLGKMLLREVLAEGRLQQHSHAGIMVINGNQVARHTYESIGFKPYQTFHADYFSQQFNLEFPGITKLGLCLNTSASIEPEIRYVL